MHKGLLIGLTLSAFCLTAHAEVQKCKDEAGKTYFSDRGCPNGEKMRGVPGGTTHTIATKSGDDEVAQGCLELYRKEHGGAAATTRVDSYRVKWVSVRDVGARRLFEIKVGLMNAMGFWAATDQHECLLRGDNITFQTTPYELVN